MTVASPSRIARRAAKFDPPEFRLPPAGMLSEQVDLSPYSLALGLVHPDGMPLMVAVWDGVQMRRLLPERASAWADELVAAGQVAPLAEVIAAIRGLVRLAGDIATEAVMRQMATAGNA